MKVIAITVLTLAFASKAFPQAPETLVRGRPVIKVTVAATEQRSEKIKPSEAPNLMCVISRIGDNLYWASRENKPLRGSVSGAFFVFVADDGSGYIKLINPQMKGAAALMGETEAKFDYVEHLSFGLGSVTYYGTLER